MNLKLLRTVLLIITSLGCNTNNVDDTVLQIGEYKLTTTELELKRQNERYKPLGKQALEDRLIQEGYILAFALDNKYDTITALNKLLEYASKSFAARVDGFVWNKKVKPKLQIAEEEIQNAYRKRSQEKLLDIIRFREDGDLNYVDARKKDFSLLKKKVSADHGSTAFTIPVRFPYYPLSVYLDGLDKAKVGDVFGPVATEDGYAIVRIAAIKPIKQNTYEQEKAGIKQELIFGLRQKYIWETQKKIFKAANPEMNKRAIRRLASKFNAGKKSWPGVKPDLILMNYTFKGKRMPYAVSDFREFVTNEPVFFGSLSEPADIMKMLRSFIIQQYLFAEAEQLKITTDEEFLRFRKSYQEKIFLEHYKRTYLYPKLLVQTTELENYYRRYSDNFKGFESATVSIYKFKDIQKAFQGRMLISRKLLSSLTPSMVSHTANTPPSLHEVPATKVKVNDLSNDPKVIETILKLHPGQISSPIQVRGEFLVIALASKKGSATLPFIYAKAEIKQLIYSQKERQLMAKLVKNLKAVYPLEKNQIKDYLF